MLQRWSIPFLLVTVTIGGGVPANAQSQNGCPAGEFTLDGCVLCVPPHALTATGNSNPSLQPCYTCALAPLPPGEGLACGDYLRRAIDDAGPDPTLAAELYPLADQAAAEFELGEQGRALAPLNALLERVDDEAGLRITELGAAAITTWLAHLADQLSMRGMVVPPRGMVMSARFTQLDWLADDRTVLYRSSRVGIVELDFGPGAALLIGGDGGRLARVALAAAPMPPGSPRSADSGPGGFINIVTDVAGGTGPEWSVRNYYANYGDLIDLLRSTPDLKFDLTVANGTPAPAVVYHLALTADPLMTEPASTLPLVATIQSGEYLTGGLGEGSGSWLLPDNLPVEPLVPRRPRRSTSARVADGDIPAVSAGRLGCAPASAAQSIHYLMNGTGIDPIQTIYGELEFEMNTTNFPAPGSPGGTTPPDMVSGKQAYTDSKGLPIDTRLVDGRNAIEQARRALARGADVEVALQWSARGGHVAMITRIDEYPDGSYEIHFVEDPNQGDGMAEIRTDSIRIRPDGRTGNRSRSLVGFVIEERTD